MISRRRLLMACILDSGSLPAGYLECEYIESTGTQYIDTGIGSTNTTGCYLVAQFLSAGILLGTLEAGVGRFQPYFREVDNLISHISLSGTSLTISTTEANNKNTLEYNVENRDIKFNGTSVGTVDNIGATNNHIYIFKRNHSTPVACSAKLYELQLYDNGVLIRNFIPCLDTLMVPCLYDTVTKQTFYNQGTGTFDYRLKVNLPREYQQVEYIESTGTQYIDTNIQMKDIGRFECDVKNTIPSSMTKYNGFCGRYSTSTALQLIQNYSNSTISARWLNASAGTMSDDTTFHYISMNRTKIVFDNVTTNISQNALTDTLSLLLFRRRSNDGSAELQSDDTGYWQCKDVVIHNTSNVLSYQFVPCYRKSDNEIGLYDIVNGVFYTNQGTGTFIKGNNV